MMSGIQESMVNARCGIRGDALRIKIKKVPCVIEAKVSRAIIIEVTIIW